MEIEKFCIDEYIIQNKKSIIALKLLEFYNEIKKEVGFE